ncbi:uncharacterized protein AMSG_11484, partial [Thecamonas trahens ATCC 50062]
MIRCVSLPTTPDLQLVTRLAAHDGAYFAAAIATAQAGKAAADALAEVLRLLANPCLEAVAASKSLLYAALADDADGVVVPVWQAV